MADKAIGKIESPASRPAVTPQPLPSHGEKAVVESLPSQGPGKTAEVEPKASDKSAEKSSEKATEAGQVDKSQLTDELSEELQEEEAAKKADKKEDEPEVDEAAEREKRLQELEKEIEAKKQELQEDLKSGDIASYQKHLGELQGLEKEYDGLKAAAEAAQAPAQPVQAPAQAAPAQAAPAQAAPMQAAPAAGSYPASAGSAPATPAGQINGPVLPFNGTRVKPLDNYRVTSEFGEDRGNHRHTGIDLAAASGTPIKAAADGTVTRVATDAGGYGNWVEVKHSDGSVTRYAHMSAFGNIKVGQEVGAGSVLGAVGSTGNSTGPHLHFEWRDANGKAMDPRLMLNF